MVQVTTISLTPHIGHIFHSHKFLTNGVHEKPSQKDIRPGRRALEGVCITRNLANQITSLIGYMMGEPTTENSTIA